MSRLAILGYHRIGEPPPDWYSWFYIPEPTFAAHLTYLKDEGWCVIDREIIDLMNRVKPPYNVSGIAQRAVIDALDDEESVRRWIDSALQQRTILAASLEVMNFVEAVYPSDANFILVKVSDANALYRFLLEKGVVVRNRNNIELCEGCLRITVGTAEENARLTDALMKYGLLRNN